MLMPSIQPLDAALEVACVKHRVPGCLGYPDADHVFERRHISDVRPAGVPAERGEQR